MFRTLDQADLRGKRVLVRVDLNVPVENGKVADSTRIERVAPTIGEIADKGGKVILLSHFGRPKGRDPTQSLKPLAPAIAQVLKRPVAFADDCVGATGHGGDRCDETGRYPVPGEHALPRRGRKRRPRLRRSARRARRHLRERRVLGVASRACFGRGPRPQAAELCRPHHAGRARRTHEGAGDADPSGCSDCGGSQDIDQARSARQPARQGRSPRHRRRHGQYLPGGARACRRQVLVRARSLADRARDHGQGEGQWP